MVYNENITTDQYTSKNFTLEEYDPDNEKLDYFDRFTFKANDGKVNSSSIGTAQ